MLEADDLSRSYDGRTAVEGVKLRVEPGRIVGIVGTNGAGKTTTIKMLAGVLAATRGQATLEGQPTFRPATRRGLGYLPEESPLYDDMNAIDYLVFFGALYGIPRAESKRRAEELLRRLNLPSTAWTQSLGTLSKGMRRKTAIARCLLHDPPVLVLDEPTSGLDPFTARDLAETLRQLRSEGKAILLSAHDLAQVEGLCDQILVLHGGRVVAQGTLQELRSTFGETRYRLRASIPFAGSVPQGSVHAGVVETLTQLEACLAQVKKGGGIVLEVESVFPSLDEIMTRAAANHA